MFEFFDALLRGRGVGWLDELRAALHAAHDFEFDRTDRQPIAHVQQRVRERFAVKQRAVGPAMHNRGARTAQNRAVDRPHACERDANGANVGGTKRGFGTGEVYELFAAVRSDRAEDERFARGSQPAGSRVVRVACGSIEHGA